MSQGAVHSEVHSKPVRHVPVHIWQERPGEFSYVCSCGMHMKHQQFGEWPACADDVLGGFASADEFLTAQRHRALRILDAALADKP